MRNIAVVTVLCLAAAPAALCAKEKPRMPRSRILDTVLQNTKPLTHPRGRRLPLYVWRLMSANVPGKQSELEAMLRRLNERGIAFAATWSPRPQSRVTSLAGGFRIASAQRKLGLEVNVNVNACLHRFFNGQLKTAHVSADGDEKPFFDLSFVKNIKMGCPFAAGHRYPAIREQIEYFARAYQAKGVDIHFAFADWEIDGPIEWNGAWSHSKRCTRCRKHVADIDDFTQFQSALRKVRCDMQKRVYADPLKARFPKVLVGNYAVYPHDGWRYWYDWFEEFTPGAPHTLDHRARHRKWFHEFPTTGYTCAMPVVYAWRPSYAWTDFDNADYHWFYFMLKAASNAGKHTPANTPVISFVSCLGALSYARNAPEKPFSVGKYQDLLWHMLLRGTDAFFVYSGRDQLAEELTPVHRVYAAALEYADFLNKGKPVCFETPSQPGPVVSAVKLGNRALVYRTDFDNTKKPVRLKLQGRTLTIPRASVNPRIITLSD